MAEYLAVANLLLFRLLIHLLLLAATAVVSGAILCALCLLVITVKQTLSERRENGAQKEERSGQENKSADGKLQSMQAYVDSQVQPEDQEGQEDTRRLLSRIDAALEQIAQDYAAVGEDQKMVAFRLKYINGKTYEQIAEQMETHENTPHNWINQINKRLAVYLYGVQALR